MDSNPIFRSELVRASRQRRHYAMRAATGLILMHVAWTLYDSLTWSAVIAAGGDRSHILRHLSRFADLAVLELIWAQGMAIILLVPGLMAGSIAEEDRRGTMLALLTSPLSSGTIVLGKLAARLVHVWVAVAIGLPIVVPMSLLGLLDSAIVFRAYVMLLCLAVFVGSLSLLISAVVLRPRLAVFYAYLAIGGWLLLPIWSAPLAAKTGWPFLWLRSFNGGLLQVHPLEAAEYLWHVPMAELFNPPGFAWAWLGLSKTFPRVIANQLAFSTLFVLLASLLLRPMRSEVEQVRRTRRGSVVSSRPVIGDDALLWKESYAHGGLSRRAACLGIGLLVVTIVGPLIESAAVSFREWRSSWSDDATGFGARGSMNQSLRQLNAGLYLAGLIAVAASAATSVTGERERGTWTILTMTPVTGREVAHAKVSGTLRSVSWLAIPFLILWGIGLVTGSAHPLGVLAAAACLLVFARYGVALGVLCSMLSQTSERAILMTSVALLAGNAIPLLCVPINLIGALAGSWQGVYLFSLTPFIEWISLASPEEIRWGLDGRTWEQSIELPGGLWQTWVHLEPGLIRIYLVSLVLHVLGTTVAIRAAAWVFDTERDGSRRPDLSSRASGRSRQAQSESEG